MVKQNYLEETTAYGKRVFYPMELILKDDIPLFALLTNDSTKQIFKMILTYPGKTQGNIAEQIDIKHQTVMRSTNKLEELGLIKAVTDGKYKRYYPTENVLKKRDEYREHSKGFRKYITRVLESEGLVLSIIKSTDVEFSVKVTEGKKKSTLNIQSDPFLTLLK